MLMPHKCPFPRVRLAFRRHPQRLSAIQIAARKKMRIFLTQSETQRLQRPAMTQGTPLAEFFFVFFFCKTRERDSASPANPKSARHGAAAFVAHNSRLASCIDADKFSLDLSLWMSRISSKRIFVTSTLENCLLQHEVTASSLGKALKGK